MKLYLVIDQKGLAQPCFSFKEAKNKYDQLTSSFLRTLVSNPTLRYRRYYSKDDSGIIMQLTASYCVIKEVNGSIKKYYNQEIFSLQTIEIND